MKKIKAIIIITIIIIVISVLYININNIYNVSYNIKLLLYGEPIDENTGLINNEFFNLDSNNPEIVAKGFNDAITYASSNNIEYLKLNKGEYIISDTIYLKSNICLDLNGSTIIYATNDKTSYSLLRINNENNIDIRNGKLIGDKESHNYGNTPSTHEWGMGIRIHAGKNINISNLNISNMTGDGIYISQYGNENENLNNSENIKINNCIINRNRRQGISIISGENIDIFNNAIYCIEGTNPQSGIDLESNYDYEKINNINIYNNVFYDFNNKVAIILYSKVYNVNIFDNTIDGSISIYEIIEKINIENNKLNNGKIYTNLNSSDCDKILNYIYIMNNEFNNYEVLTSNQVKHLNVYGNINTEGYGKNE